MKEEWKKINGFPNYEISNFGRVKSLARNKYKRETTIIKHCYNPAGYPQVGLWDCGRGKTIRIHILVATHFLGSKPHNKSFVCHKDDNKLNTHVSNFYWGDNKSNVIDRYKNGITRLSEQQIRDIRVLAKEGVSRTEISKRYNYSQGHITNIVNFKRAKHIN